MFKPARVVRGKRHKSSTRILFFLCSNHSTGMGPGQPGHCTYTIVDGENERMTEATSDAVVLNICTGIMAVVCEVRGCRYEFAAKDWPQT